MGLIGGSEQVGGGWSGGQATANEGGQHQISMAASRLIRLGLVVTLLGVWNLVEGRAPRKGRPRQQGVLRAEARPQDVQPMSRARRAPDPRKGSPSEKKRCSL